MTDIDYEFSGEIPVILRRALASDADVIEAMLVSTQGAELLAHMEELGLKGVEGKINYLMSNRHGSPFEHNFFNFFMDAPIKVYREHHRHRIGISYNEESGRYTQLRPKFYVAPPTRKLVQVPGSKPGHYEFELADEGQYEAYAAAVKIASTEAYETYLHLLNNVGIAKEAARDVLPVNIFSAQVVSLNARSMMAFLSLRQAPRDEWPTQPLFPSRPMHEINVVADAYEEALAELMPLTHKAFVNNGRVSP